MRLLLLNPKSKAQDALPVPPLGILYLAAYVRDICDVRVFDDNRGRNHESELEEHIGWADIIGFTGTTSQSNEAYRLAHIAKRMGKTTIYGGSHATAVAEHPMDIVVRGEGEQALRQIILENKRAGELKVPYTKNLDLLPFPARDLIPIREYGTRELERFEGIYTHMMTGRGCSSQCIFCSSPMMWGKPRLVSAPRVFEEMMEIFGKYGIKNIHFQDDTFTLSKKRVHELCGLIGRSGIDFKWSCQTRPDMVDKRLLETMKIAGCVQIEYGVESGDDKVLKTACKGYTKAQIKNAFRVARQVGIRTYGFFVVGLPGETIWTWLKSILFALSLKMSRSVWTVLMPFPGTRVAGMVTVLDTNYSNWLYKRPVIKVGPLSPRVLMAMRYIADKVVNGPLNKGVYSKERVKNES